MRTLARLFFGVAILVPWLGANAAEFTPEIAKVLTIDKPPTRHWVWLSDISYPNFTPGKAHLIDAANATHLGMITMGYGITPLGLPTHGKSIYSVETHYDRTARGNRTDVISIYNPRTLNVESEIPIPQKKISAVPMLSFSGITDDDRFLLIYNFTPSQSVTVVDLQQRKVASEIDTAGCGLVFPVDARRFAMLCGDARMTLITLSDAGTEQTRTETAPLFDPKREFLTEKAVRHGNTWVFVSNHGEIKVIDFSGKMPKIASTWSLFSEDELAANWKIGGVQHLAAHQASGSLYAVVHQGGRDTHKLPGVDVFVYDIASGKRTRSLKLEREASSIQVTQGADPLLLATNAYPAILDIYDADSGELKHTMNEVATTPMLLQTAITAKHTN